MKDYERKMFRRKIMNVVLEVVQFEMNFRHSGGDVE